MELPERFFSHALTNIHTLIIRFMKGLYCIFQRYIFVIKATDKSYLLTDFCTYVENIQKYFSSWKIFWQISSCQFVFHTKGTTKLKEAQKRLYISNVLFDYVVIWSRGRYWHQKTKLMPFKQGLNLKSPPLFYLTKKPIFQIISYLIQFLYQMWNFFFFFPCR